MYFQFVRISSSHMIYTITVVVHIVLTNGFECDNVGKCLCTDVEDYREADCSGKELRTIPEGLQSAQQYAFEYNNFNTRNNDFRMSWKSFLGTVNGSITYLYFSSNPLMDIPEWLFEERLTTLTLLSLSNCQINSLSENAFSELGNLEDLILSENPLAVLPVGIFRNQIKLILLYLDSCELRQLDKDIFAPLLDLFYLELSSNNIKFLPPKSFSYHRELSWLNLRNNKLEYLPPDFLKENTDMTRLHLDTNRLEYLPDDFLIQNPKMEELTLSRNKIKIMAFDRFFSLVQTLIRNKKKAVASDSSPFDCIECLDCNCKIVEAFNEWIEKYDFNATEELDMKTFKEISCSDGTKIVKLEPVNENCSDFNFNFSRDPTLAGIVTTLCVASLGTLASLTAVFIVIKRIIKTDHFKEETDESHAENDIKIDLPDFDDGFMMTGERFRNIPAVDHRIITA